MQTGPRKILIADPARAIQWRAFVRRSRFTGEPDDLEKLVAEVGRFAFRVPTAANEGPSWLAVQRAGRGNEHKRSLLLTFDVFWLPERNTDPNTDLENSAFASDYGEPFIVDHTRSPMRFSPSEFCFFRG
jgi:hypothetical protein